MGMYPQFIPKTMKSRPSTWRREPLPSVTISTSGATAAAADASNRNDRTRTQGRALRPVRRKLVSGIEYTGVSSG